MIRTIKELEELKKRSPADFELVLDRVRPVIKDVKLRGDDALLCYSKKYDDADLTKNTLKFSERDIKDAYKKVDEKTIKAIKKAAKNIEEYCKLQLPKEWLKQAAKGIKLGQLVRPLDSVGCYVPCGNFPLPSSVLMSVIPAKVAGVKKIIICTPPRQNNQAILVAADILGVKDIYRVGGAQAIAAMAYSTETIPKVNKIVGPGNVFVTAAKKLVYGDAGIDFIAGPSEVMIIAEKGNAEFIAADMIAQAEHDRLASAILVTTNKELATQVSNKIKSQLKNLKNNLFASESLRKYGGIIIVKNLDEAFNIANEFAPEHLQIMSGDESLLKKVRNAGAIFLGEFSPVAAGDYASGPNHVLPTKSFAKVRAGLSVMDFIKMPSIQKLSKQGLSSLKDTITRLAEEEGLEAHKKSVEVRLE